MVAVVTGVGLAAVAPTVVTAKREDSVLDTAVVSVVALLLLLCLQLWLLKRLL